MIQYSYQCFSIFTFQTWYWVNSCPWWFLNKDNIKRNISLKDCVSKQIVLSNILEKNFYILYTHACLLLISEWIDLLLLSQISWYFFVCHSLLNLYFQNRHRLESAWWLLLQFKHLKEWRHDFPCFVSSLGGFVLKLAL